MFADGIRAVMMGARSGNGHEGATSGEAGGSEGTTAHELSEGHSSGLQDHHGDSQVLHLCSLYRGRVYLSGVCSRSCLTQTTCTCSSEG